MARKIFLNTRSTQSVHGGPLITNSWTRHKFFSISNEHIGPRFTLGHLGKAWFQQNLQCTWEGQTAQEAGREDTSMCIQGICVSRQNVTSHSLQYREVTRRSRCLHDRIPAHIHQPVKLSVTTVKPFSARLFCVSQYTVAATLKSMAAFLVYE